MISSHTVILSAGLALSFLCNITVAAERMDSYRIAKRGTADLKYPEWFKQSFLDIRDDLDEARAAGKRGVIIFFSQTACQHCQAFLDTTLKEPDIRERLQNNYDIIGLDIFNDLEVTTIDASKMAIKDFAQLEKARFTPTLVFYGVENQRLLRIVGFYPPQRFRKVLDYIESEHFKRETFSAYMQRATANTDTQQPLTVDHSLFAKPPYDLQRALVTKPAMVIFDRGDCAPCVRFRERVLGFDKVRELLGKYYAIHINRTDNTTRLVDPKGRTITPRQWTQELELTYEPSVLFFDTNGEEVHRLDSEVGEYRMMGSMEYVLAQGYRQYSQYQRWRREQVIQERQNK